MWSIKNVFIKKFKQSLKIKRVELSLWKNYKIIKCNIRVK